MILKTLFIWQTLTTSAVTPAPQCVVTQLAVLDEVCAFSGWHCFETQDCGDGKIQWQDRGCASGSEDCKL